MQKAKVIGILREIYNNWERRAPLSPKNVKELTSKGIQVLVQPSNIRIFTDKEYVSAGAIVTEDLQTASVLLGVKQIDIEKIIPDKTYLFFTHTIKGQRENMPLLSNALAKRVTLIDYECITQDNKRLISFGTNAGRAGMMAGFRGFGERLLHLGYSTPFLHIGSAYMYRDLKEAKRAVEIAGKKIKEQGLPQELSPMTFVFTGKGKVSHGAQEMFQLMPHVMVHPSELANVPRDTHVLYGSVVGPESLVERKDRSASSFTKEEYYAHPENFNGIFHSAIAPYTSMLINGMYWDARFPRLLTKQHIQEQSANINGKLLGIVDISCDVGGSIECTEYRTEIDRPFALYDIHRKKMEDTLTGDGIMMTTVDILPSEFAEESSLQFGDSLVEFAEMLAKDLRLDSMPEPVQRACIVHQGRLTPPFQYLSHMLSESVELPSKRKHGGRICFNGHLFDTGFINEALNSIEKLDGQFEFVDCVVRPNLSHLEKQKSVSNVILLIWMDSLEQFHVLLRNLNDLASSLSDAKIVITELDRTIQNSTNAPQSAQSRVLCLGSGLVALPLVEYLSRSSNQEIIVVSSVPNEALLLKKKLDRENIYALHLDVEEDKGQLQSYIEKCNCVVSLLPAPMHTAIAEYCIHSRTPLVTASYVSPEMKLLDQRAREADIPILCELGLDPGMDHLSAMKIIDQVKNQGGDIVSFSSVCGGLPAPEAVDNLIGYKFSWSPRGVLTAALNSAQYRKDNRLIQINGHDLLKSFERVNFLPTLALEQIPNRNSLLYADIYNIPAAHTIFRGTLRYAGCCSILAQLRDLGLLETETLRFRSWPELIMYLCERPGARKSLQSDGMAFLHWLGVFDDAMPIADNQQTLDAFCTLLQRKLTYLEGDRDMVIMHHEFQIQYKDRKMEKRTSTYVGYGSEDGSTIMAKTVGITAAIGVQLILEGAVRGRGVLTPTTRDVYEPALEMLRAEGIAFREKVF